ncbi:LuxR C-terminal-related transcriptional regulator [Streptosporangium sandarakinum]|uniref:LuxR C-terminal-related transcriptional regulator n=1 Tax=Streptosporangium TaxID=2000 RepID=UPI0031F84028
MLEALGLRARTQTVYLLMLDHPEWGPDLLAAHLEISEADIRSALDDLADKHLLRPMDEDSGRLYPVSPEVGLSALLARSELELAARQRQIEATRTAVATLASRYSGKDRYAPELVHQLVGLEAVRYRLEELAQTARHECLSFLPGGAQLSDTIEAGKPLNQQALERGVALRTIYQESFRNDPATLQYVRLLTSLGEKARIVPSLPMLMIIVDGEVALVPLDPGNGRRGALELRSQGAVAAMKVLFEQVWAAASPWDAKPAADSDGLSKRDREILALLADGHTDESISRKLGLSLRTIRRLVSDLMKRLNARSRFEAGILAVRSGWL